MLKEISKERILEMLYKNEYRKEKKDTGEELHNTKKV